jgi:hypothetical protein
MDIITIIALVFLIASFVMAIINRDFSPLLLAVYSLATVAVLSRVL